jgi:hypothetical protein
MINLHVRFHHRHPNRDTEANYIAWQGSAVTKSFVAETTPLLGSPFDHRLNILCGETLFQWDRLRASVTSGLKRVRVPAVGA